MSNHFNLEKYLGDSVQKFVANCPAYSQRFVFVNKSRKGKVTRKKLRESKAINHSDMLLVDAEFYHNYLYFSILISGIGFSLIFTASLCLVPEKFTSYRIVASGISTSGAGIGTILWS